MVKPIEHRSKYFEVKGPLNIPQHRSGEMPLFQAGASEASRNFTASGGCHVCCNARCRVRNGTASRFKKRSRIAWP